MFSKNTSEVDRKASTEILGISRTMEFDSYLGLPLMFGRNKTKKLRFIKDRLWQKIQSWGARLLSYAGRAVLIQAIGQATPLYVMSCFKLSRGFLNDLNMMLAGYWWGDKGSKKRIHWKNWEHLCCSKLDGGLGFRDFESFNLALLAKQWWRVLQNENSLCFKVLKSRYFPHLPAHRPGNVCNASYLWKSLMEGKK